MYTRIGSNRVTAYIGSFPGVHYSTNGLQLSCCWLSIRCNFMRNLDSVPIVLGNDWQIVAMNAFVALREKGELKKCPLGTISPPPQKKKVEYNFLAKLVLFYKVALKQWPKRHSVLQTIKRCPQDLGLRWEDLPCGYRAVRLIFRVHGRAVQLHADVSRNVL